MSLSKNFYDMDPYEDIVQEGTEIGGMDFNFDDKKPEVVEEGVFDHGFFNLRGVIADALKNTKYKVSNIVRGMLGKDMFTISDDNTITTVDSTGSGCKVVTRDNKGHMKINFNNISLSKALIEIPEIFKHPEHILEGAIEDLYYKSIYQESDDDIVKEAIDKENAPEEPEAEEPRVEETVEEDSEVKEEPESTESTETTETEETSTEPSSEDALEDSTTPEGDDLKDFGSDTSAVQNEYDPKEIEILNKLIAAEGEAINDYFDASKDSHDNNARRLYSDIGHEERFHMEQLLFQKAQFTGEKYEPRDPEVRKEYEELLQMGMDDQTAAVTAIDKVSLDDSGDFDEIDIEVIEHSTDNILTMLLQNEILMEASMYVYDKRAYNSIIEPYGVILEQYYQEEVVNTANAPREVKKMQNPIKLLIKGLKAAVNGLLSAADNIRAANERNRVKRDSRRQWLKKNGIGGLFASGVSFYFYNDKDAAFNMVVPVQYVDLLYRLSVDIGKRCGVTVTPQGYHGTIKNPVKYNSIQDGMAKIKDLKLYKTKIVVNDNNKDALIDEFFGYSNDKVNVKVWNAEANRAIYESNNVYTKLEIFAAITNQYQQITAQILQVMEGLQGNMNSVYYKNRNLYNECVNNMKIIVQTYSKLITAVTADLAEMLRLDKEAIKITRSRDAGNPLPEGEPDRRTSGSNGNNRIQTTYAKTKK